MRVLIAEDDHISCRMLESSLIRWGYDVISCADGIEAWTTLQQEDAPKLVILDWMMPGIDGTDVCRKVRQSEQLQSTYIILLTSRDDKKDIVAGLQSGANDYVTKPVAIEELQARLQIGRRMVELHTELADRVKELEQALSQVKQLETLIPICSYCKKIRDDGDYWNQLEAYFAEHTDVRFSHSICPECYENIVEKELETYEGGKK